MNFSQFTAEEKAALAIEQKWNVDPATQKCRACGCTNSNCDNCIACSGATCMWIEPDLCSVCAPQAVWSDAEGDIWIIAASAADAAYIYAENTGDTDDVGPWFQIADDRRLGIDPDLEDQGFMEAVGAAGLSPPFDPKLFVKTAGEWALLLGRGILGGNF